MRPRGPDRSPEALDQRDQPVEMMYVRVPVAAAGYLTTLALLAGAAPAMAYSDRSVGSAEQIAWVRRAAHRFVIAELAANGSEACAVLNARLRATLRGRSCAQRWNARLASMLRENGMRVRLRSELPAVAAARVVVRGNVASIELPTPLVHGPNRFVWTENCWILEG